MKIGVISDIHGIFPGHFRDFMSDVDEIWCLGDIWTEDIFAEIESLGKPVVAVSGNWEEEQGSPLLEKLPKSRTIEREGLKIKLAHQRQYNLPESVGLHCFGHIHRFSYATVYRGKNTRPLLLLNPGAVTPLYEKTASAVTLEIKDGQVFNCRRKTVECDLIFNDKNQFSLIYDKTPSAGWIMHLFGTPFAFSVAADDKDPKTYDDLSSHIVKGDAATGHYMLSFFKEEKIVGGAFIDSGPAESTMNLHGISIMDDSEITYDDIISIIRNWYGVTDISIK